MRVFVDANTQTVAGTIPTLNIFLLAFFQASSINAKVMLPRRWIQIYLVISLTFVLVPSASRYFCLHLKNISGSAGWFKTEWSSDIHCSQMLNPTDADDPLRFPLVLSSVDRSIDDTKLGTDICAPQRMNYNNFGRPQSVNEAPSNSLNLSFAWGLYTSKAKDIPASAVLLTVPFTSEVTKRHKKIKEINPANNSKN